MNDYPSVIGCACESAYDDILQAIKSKSLEAVKSEVTSLSIKTLCRYPCIMINACLTGKIEIVQYLMDLGLSINERACYDGLTIFSRVCDSLDIEMIKFLVQEGAEVEHTDDFANTMYFGTEDRLLMDFGKCKNTQQVEVYALLKKSFPDIFMSLDDFLVEHKLKNFTFSDLMKHVEFYPSDILDSKECMIHLLDVHSFKLNDLNDDITDLNAKFIRNMIAYDIYTPDLTAFLQVCINKPKILKKLLCKQIVHH